MRDLKALDIDAASWEGLAADSTMWRSALNQHLTTVEEKLINASGHAERSATTPADQRPHIDTTFVVASASPATGIKSYPTGQGQKWAYAYGACAVNS